MLSIETCQNLSRDPVACADRLGSARSNHGQRPFHCPCRSTSRGMGIWILGAAISSNKDNKLGWLTKQLRLAKNRSWTNQTRIAELERPVMLTHGRWRRFALMQLEQSSKGFSWHTHNIDNCWMQLFPIFIVFCLWWCFAMCTGWCLLHYSAHSTNAVMFSCQALTGWSEFILYCTVVSFLVFVIFIQETMASMTVQSASLLPEGIHHILSHQFPALSWLRHTLLFDARANPNDPVPCWFPHRSNESNESNRVNLF